jgi:stage V sporulation protein G
MGGKMKIIRMNPLKNKSGKTVAFFDLQTKDGIVLRGFRLVNGSNGLFIASPDEKGKDGKYYENVILPKEIKERVQEIAVEEYNKAG